ncbi:MAG TPA: Asp-tRNA(Asn)/Glu-tRNA(Gln) amidotransferase subunit GatB [Acidimicrobiia bacterium]|nr:Asp-tRNA(Asn)/Glu-tRNA(Gln) amidotransferase subunit GatB [Acidimicrobiia bacterium]
MGYEAAIGVETHVELTTRSKMFCGCPNHFGAGPNTAICPVCLGLPGALPVPNERAIELTVSLGLALDAGIAPRSLFHRKNYFYADLPKNYQISQFDLPLCRGGHLDVETEQGTARVGITRVHLEEDTGKSTHLGESGRIRAAEAALLDFNRSGVPLMEVVSEPDIRSPEEARAYAAELRAIILALGLSDARLEEGRMRFDANISVRPEGSEGLGTKVEVKNMNSLRSLQRALAFEIDRQSALLAAGQPVEQETRHWDEAAGCTRAGRSKEESSDYRYFPEPDLVPVELDAARLERLRAALPELPAPKRARYRALGLDGHAARLVVEEGYGALFEGAVAAGADARATANWLVGEVTAHLRRLGVGAADTPLAGAHLAELLGLIEGGRLSATAAKEVLAGVLEGEGSPEEVALRRDLIQISDEGVLLAAVDEVFAAHPAEVERLRAGEERLIGFLVGRVMQATAGKADPRRVSEVIQQRASA